MNVIRPGDRELASIEMQSRAPIREMKASIQEAIEAAWPKAHRDTLLHAELARKTDSAVGSRDRWGKIVYPSDTTTAFPELTWATLLDVLGIDQVHSLISRRIDALGLPEGLPPGERAARVRQLETELFDLEVGEEQAICALEAEVGAHVLRRPEVDPAAVLAAWERATA